MYKKFYGLHYEPFSIAVTPKFLFGISQYQDALAHLEYATKKNGIILITGEVGIGKTQVVKTFLENLTDSKESLSAGYLIATKLDDEDLLKTICDIFEIKLPKRTLSKKDLIDLFNKFLLKNQKKKIITLLIIDEAQIFDTKQLELLRYLTNLENDFQKLLRLVLVAQPEFNYILEQKENLPLKQRIIEKIHLSNLSVNDSQNYIQHRLFVAGAKRLIFDNESLKYIAKLSKGIPRLINIYCDRVLLAGFSENQYLINKAFVKKVLAEKIRIDLNMKFVFIAIFSLVLLLGAGFSVWKYYPNLYKKQDELLIKVGEVWNINNPICGENFFCKDMKNMSFQEVRGFGFPFFIFLNNEKYLVRDSGGINLYLENTTEQKEIDLQEFLKIFDGKIQLAVPVPKDFKEEVKENDSGRYVEWIIKSFSKIFNNEKLKLKTKFDKDMIKSLEQFQKENGLVVSQTFGIREYMKLLKYSGNVSEF